METDVYEYTAYQILNTPLRPFPFDHIYVKDVFPKDFYRKLLAHLPNTAEYIAIAKLGRVPPGTYKERSVFPLISNFVNVLNPEKREFWHNFIEVFVSDRFKALALKLFEKTVRETLQPDILPSLHWEPFLVRDVTNYSIGPHTDSPGKVITFLFYLPEDESHPNIGTSIFAAKDPDLSDKVGVHRKFEEFKLMATMPFLPNSMFGFIRTDHSWHGVPPIAEEVVRNSLTFQLRLK